MIEIKGVQKAFGELTVLKNINLTIQDGDIYGLVGKSGAGKSTLLYCLNGMEKYDEGTIKVDGVEVSSLDKKQLRQYRKNIGMIFQQFPLISRKNVYDNIGFPMKCWGYSKNEIDERVRELAELVGITDKLYNKPNTLSGGQKQRVAIARALSMNPQILLSDESTSALDPGTTAEVLKLLQKINSEFGITIIVVTHQMSVIRDICNNVSLLENGRIVLSGPVNELFLKQPEALRRFMMEDDIEVSPGAIALQIMLTESEHTQKALSRMSSDLNIEIPIIGGKIEKYRGELLGALVIEVMPLDLGKVCSWLDSNQIIWHNYIPLNKYVRRKQ